MNPRPWKKVLYEKQNYPDNYVDPAVFLSALRCEPVGCRPEAVPCLLAAGRLTQEVSLGVLCICLFVWLNGGRSEDLRDLLLPLALALLAVLAVALLVLARRDPQSVHHLVANLCVFLLFGFGFSPILKDLTSSISTDTIYAMVSLAGLVHLFVQDYGAQAPVVSPTLAFNASLFAAVCLASRLQSTMQAFVLLTFCAGVFAGSPLLHRVSMRWSDPFQASLTLCLFLGSLACLAVLWGPGWRPPCCLLLATVAFLNFLCPWLFLRLQKHKENISGPWDEAVVCPTSPSHSEQTHRLSPKTRRKSKRLSAKDSSTNWEHV